MNYPCGKCGGKHPTEKCLGISPNIVTKKEILPKPDIHCVIEKSSRRITIEKRIERADERRKERESSSDFRFKGYGGSRCGGFCWEEPAGRGGCMEGWGGSAQSGWGGTNASSGSGCGGSQPNEGANRENFLDIADWVGVQLNAKGGVETIDLVIVEYIRVIIQGLLNFIRHYPQNGFQKDSLPPKGFATSC